jgi:predicted ATP-dependent serine protease
VEAREEKREAFDKTALNDAIMLLTQAFTQDSPKKIEKAIEILSRSVLMHKEVELIRGDQVKAVESGEYYQLGIPWFDDWTGGVRKKEIVLIAGVPFAGKSHMLGYFGANGLLEGAHVLHVVGEDLLTDIQYMYVNVVGEDNPALQNLYFLDMLDATFGLREVEAGVEKYKKMGVSPDIVVIDNLDLLHTSSYKPDWEGVTELCRDLKLFAKRQDNIVITSSLSNFSKEQRGMARLSRAKVGKSANMDVLIMIDDAIAGVYNMSLVKRRGKKVAEENKQKLIECNWTTMTASEVI